MELMLVIGVDKKMRQKCICLNIIYSGIRYRVQVKELGAAQSVTLPTVSFLKLYIELATERSLRSEIYF